MADETIVAVYDTHAHAELAVADLKQAGVPESAISVHANSNAVTDTTTAVAPREEGFWASLFGGSPDHDTAVYERSVDAGSSVVTVKVPDAHVSAVVDILESHKPIDIDERATGYGLSQTVTTAPIAGAATTATAGVSHGHDESLSLSKETLAVGKRVVNRGGTRIRRYVVETPVQENLSLHSERVVLDRRPVTDARPVTDSAFTDKSIEMTEMAEEAVISKTAHVYEEVGLRKEVADRVETVRDTVRKEEVEVVQVPGTTETTTTGRTTTRRPPPRWAAAPTFIAACPGPRSSAA